MAALCHNPKETWASGCLGLIFLNWHLDFSIIFVVNVKRAVCSQLRACMLINMKNWEIC